MTQPDLKKIRDLLVANSFLNVDVALARTSGENACRTKWQTYYDDHGKCNVRTIETQLPENSNYLKLTFAFKTEDERKICTTQKQVVASAIRLIFGVSVARELVLYGLFSCQETDGGHFSDTGFASKFDNQNPNLFDCPPIEEARLGAFPLEAAILLDQAFRQEYPTERFAFMWMAVEVITRSLPVDGKGGKKRENFFEQLGDGAAAEEMKRLYDVRGKLFKEGRTDITTIEEDCWSLYTALQIMVLAERPQRDAFMEGYENYICNNP